MQTPNPKNGCAAEPGGTGRGAKAQAGGPKHGQHSTVHLAPIRAGGRWRSAIYAAMGPRPVRFRTAAVVVCAGVEAGRELVDALGLPTVAAFAVDEVEPLARVMASRHPEAAVIVAAVFHEP